MLFGEVDVDGNWGVYVAPNGRRMALPGRWETQRFGSLVPSRVRNAKGTKSRPRSQHAGRIVPEPESGWTLIELMVVLLIMGILMAIAVPTFLGEVSGSKDNNAQSILTNALQAVESYYNNYQTFCGINTTYTKQMEPGYTWDIDDTNGASSVLNQVGFENWAACGDVMAIYSWSPSGVCWLVGDNVNTYTIGGDWGVPPGISYGYTLDTSASTCANGAVVWPHNPGGWSSNWPVPPGGK